MNPTIPIQEKANLKWKLFNSIDTLKTERWEAVKKAEAEQRAAAARAEAQRRAAIEQAKAAAERAEAQRQARIANLNQEKTDLHTELNTLRGLFTGKRRREIEERLAEIDAELNKLG